MTIQEKMQLMHNNYVISWHEHVWFKERTLETDIARLEKDMETIDILGFDKMVSPTQLSMTVTAHRNCLLPQTIPLMKRSSVIPADFTAWPLSIPVTTMP